MRISDWSSDVCSSDLRFDVLTVGGNHRHLETRNAYVENGGRRAVDEAQPDLFAGFEDAGPVTRRRGAVHQVGVGVAGDIRSEEHTSELQSLMRISYAVFCLKKKTQRENKVDICA